MKDEPVAKTRHYAGPVRVITVREVSAYLRMHPSTIYRMLKNKDPGVSRGRRLALQCRYDRQLALRAEARRLTRGSSPSREVRNTSTGGPCKSPNPNPTMDNHQPANPRVICPRIAVKFARVVKQSRPELLIAAT